MNISVSFIPAELEQARRWFDWCAELGCGKSHDLYVSPFKGMAFDLSSIKGWKSVTEIKDWIGRMSDWSGDAPQRDASGPNESWRTIARYFADNKKGPFLFVEVDCIPLSPDAFDRIEAEYKRAGRRFMGARVDLPPVPPHMTGNAVYPQDVAHTSLKFMLPRYTTIEGKPYEVAFDVAGADDSLADMHSTRLIQHRFRAAPITSRQDFESIVDKEAVLYHSDKTGSVIPFLREKLSIVQAHAEPSVGARKPALVEVQALGPIDGEARAVQSSARGDGKPQVFTYYAPAPTHELILEQKRLLEHWQREWDRAGFEPVILTEHDAKRHKRFDEWSKALLAKPTVNPEWYERACWLRWIAMAMVGGLMTDYDVLPNGLDTHGFVNPEGSFPVIIGGTVPCAVFGSANQYEHAVSAFTNCEPVTENGAAHLSDMHAIDQLKFPSRTYVGEYGTTDWQKAGYIHFSNATRHGRLRSEIIEEWLKERHDRLTHGAAGMIAEIRAAHDVAQIFRAERAQGDSEIAEPLHLPPTRVGQMRAAIQTLAKLADTPSRKIQAAQELRKAGLIGKAKGRKKRKWKL